MKPIFRIAALTAFLAAPLTAQHENRALVASLYGGGADHLADLTHGAKTWFMPGYSLGLSAGVQLTRNFGVHADFTFTRNPTEGVPVFNGEDVNRFFFGAHAEYRYPLNFGLTPYVFAGMGGVSIDQLGLDAFSPATRFAVMYGGGIAHDIARSPFGVFGEVKGMTYRWSMAGFDRNMVDVVFNAGVSYRRPF